MRKENFQLNGIKTIHLYSDLSQVKGSFEVIVANILTPTIIHLKKQMTSLINEGGSIILSGITVEEGPRIEKAFSGFDLLEKNQKNEWVCFCYRK